MHKLTLDSTPTAPAAPTNPAVQPAIADPALSSITTTAKPYGTPPANPKTGRVSMPLVLGISLVVLIAGVATGLGAYQLSAKGSATPENLESIQQVAGTSVKNGDIFGSKDETAFKDSAEGYLEQGGIDGEGSHKLIRPNGESQTVYLTSSVTDLDKLVNMKVKVWGETFKGQKAGWLMDVGRIQVLETQAEKPE